MAVVEAKIIGEVEDSNGLKVSRTIIIEFDSEVEEFPIYFKYTKSSDGGPILMPQTPPVL